MSAGKKIAKEYYGVNYDLAMENYRQGIKKQKDVFLKKYPHANLKKFEFDVTVGKSGEITQKNIYYISNKEGDMISITSPGFQKSPGIHSLGLSLKNILVFNKFGDKNYDKYTEVFNSEVSKLKNNFSDRYPHAKLNKFEFDVDLNPDLSVESTSIFYKENNETSWDITSETFKEKYSDSLYWSPRIWGPRGTVQPLNMLDPEPLTFKLNRFKIFVDQNSSFISNFKPIDTAWQNKNKNKNITTAKFDYKTDPYFTSLLAAYVISYETGVSLKHLEYSTTTPKIITSIARYFVYYHMSRFLMHPDKLDFYADENIISFVQDNIPTREIWKKKLDQTQEKMSVWLAGKNKHNIRHYEFVLGSNAAQGVYGISYQELDQVVNVSSQDWIMFLKSDSDGLTKTGQKLFQNAIESYVYCILGAQAQTRWPIVGAGAKSLQTQDIFHKLVLATIAQDSVNVAISNMRQAIKDTNVVLNMVVSPGIILVPSSLIIQKEMVRGYNNALTLATNNMAFGENKNVNYVGDVNKTPMKVNISGPPGSKIINGDIFVNPVREPKKSLYMEPQEPQEPQKLQNTVDIFGSMLVIGLLIARYLI